MPAAAVIPAPKAYIKVVAVKKLVVERLGILPAGSAVRKILICPKTLTSLTGRQGASGILLRKN